VITPQAKARGWLRAGSVSVDWGWTDELSGIDSTACTTSTTVTDEGVTTLLGTCQDQAGPVGHSTVPIRIDRTKPTVRLSTPKKATYHRGLRVVATYSCSDRLSGVASCRGTVRSGKRVNTHTLGRHTFSVVATDLAGNTSTKKVTYKVVR
jgi:hypothetical protein